MRLLLATLLALPLFAQTPYSISPSQGNVIGGELVTIKGDLLPHDYEVYFDYTRSTFTTRVDASTLLAVAPPHVAGTAKISLLVYGVTVPTPLTFDYVGESRAAFERFLLPVFTPPIQGAFGSEFRTDLDAINLSFSDDMLIYGLSDACCGGPIDPARPVLLGLWGTEESNGELPALVPNGTPGRFAYVALDMAVGFEANLRAYDTSRSAENFGTEIPVVRGAEFRHEPFALLGVPLDPAFRKTLRLYAQNPTIVTIQGLGAPRTVMLTGSTDTFTPAYAQISDFPSGTGVTDVIVEVPGGAEVWAMITVTNNATQHITTIAPF
jgi:hypothetical protein